MEFTEAIGRLRGRVSDAVALGVGTDNPGEFTAAALIQIMNEAERRRLSCLEQATALRAKAEAAQHQAGAYVQVHAIAWSVYDGFVKAQERANEDLARQKAEDSAREAQIKPAAPKRRGRKKKETPATEEMNGQAIE